MVGGGSAMALKAILQTDKIWKMIFAFDDALNALYFDLFPWLKMFPPSVGAISQLNLVLIRMSFPPSQLQLLCLEP